MSGRPRKGLGKADGFFDWTPVLADPGYDAPSPEIQPLGGDLDHARVGDGVRNGLPEAAPYRWRPGEAQRDAEVAGRIAAARAAAAMRIRSAQDPATTPGGTA